MAKKSSKEFILAPTKFNLTIGENLYTLNFGTETFIRIKEENPSLSSAFSVTDELTELEVIPRLIHAAIKPEDRQWASFSEFLEQYDECTDPAIGGVLVAYISAVGGMSKKLAPAMEAVAAFQKANE